MDNETSQRLHREYLENRIRTAHPVELVNMLYETAIDSLKEAIGRLKAHDRLARSRAITRAEQAVEELLISLDHSVNAPFTRSLADLYKYCLERMIAGHATQSETAFREALSVLETLIVAWREVKNQVCGAPAGEAMEEPAERTAAEPQPSVNDRFVGYREIPVMVGSRNWNC
jgi:flagellar protein FliS